MSERIRLVLVDDQHLMREGIRTILSVHDDLEIVGQASNGEEAIDVVRRTAPDVVCMDVEMPIMDGLEATRRLTNDPAVTARILMLTTFDREDYLMAALQAGASGFLLKNARPEQLVEGIRSIAGGEALLAPAVTMAVIRRVVEATPAAAQAVVPASAAHLTERELDVLRLLARGCSNEEIAEQLYVARATVKTHVSNVLAKLGLRDRVQAVAYAYRTGIVTPD
ncbi:response regulator [Epidermidibacterium keratini]|uniref:Response regulator n=1 Tax=Epidermidibacterium keratini TaxID=1891644 RepID=A0A7L4YPR0_9ACTN|nr:response regulator transcription factor [Epidermidibacterium keratini]QHC01146.1 response regulator [Epidermidibacterium keratini]